MVVEPEKIRQHIGDVVLIVHHEDRLSLDRRQRLELAHLWAGRRHGQRQLDAKDRALARPALDLNRPSWATMIARHSPSPKPVPCPGGFVGKKGSENRPWISGAIPMPVSATSSRMDCSSRLSRVVRVSRGPGRPRMA